jgi:hypothetical protein
MALVLVAKLFFHHQGSIGCINTYPLTIITRAGVGPSMLGSNGSSLTIRTRILLAFNPITKLFEELCTNYQGVKTEKLCTL